MILERIARRRVPLGFVVGSAALVLATPTPDSLLLGTLVAAAGELVRIWAAGHLEKGREVTASGPYSVTRHPLYFGSTLIGLGLVTAAANWWVAALVLGYLAITLSAAILTEEAHLTEKFGVAYPAYRDGRSADGRRRFSFGRVIRNREYRSAIGLAVVWAVLWWKAR